MLFNISKTFEQYRVKTGWFHWWFSSHVICVSPTALQWRHYERNGVWNHQRLHCFLNCRVRCRSKKISKLCVTGLCTRNLPVTGELPAQKASNAENVSMRCVIYYGVLSQSINNIHVKQCCSWYFRDNMHRLRMSIKIVLVELKIITLCIGNIFIFVVILVKMITEEK